MRAICWFPVGLVVGAAVVWALLSGDVPSPAGAPAPPPARVLPVAAPPPDAPLEAGPPAPGDADAGAPVRHVLLAAVHAVEGNREALAIELDLALAAEADPERIAGVLRLLDAEPKRAFLEVLAGRLPRPGFDSADAAEWFSGAEMQEGSFRLLAAAIEEPDADVPALARRLVAADPVAAATLLLRLSAEMDFGVELLMLIAEALAEEGRPDLSRPFVDRVLAEDPGTFRAIDLLAKSDSLAGLAAAETGVRHAPENASLWGKLAELRRGAGDLTGAFEAWRQAALLATDDDERRPWLAGMATADPAAALPFLRTYATGDDDETLGLLGRTLALCGSREEAFDVLLAAHRLDLSDSEWLHRLVALDSARAEALLRQEIERGETDPSDEVIGAYAQALLRGGRPDAAFDSFLRANEMDSDDWEWLRGLAHADPSRATPILEALREESPGSPNVLGALGDAWAGLGRKSEAADLYQQALEESDGNPRWMAALASVEPGRGLPMILSAVEAKPLDDEVWGALGDAYRSMGRLDEARAAYDKALALDPADWEWNLNREQLR